MNLLQLKEKTEEKKRLTLLLKKVKLELHAMQIKLAQLTKQLEKELKDVQQLEGSGLTSMFYSFLGNKVEKLDKERQEYLAAKLKHENCVKEVAELESEIEKLNNEILKLGTPEEDYNYLLNEKKVELKNQNDGSLLKFEEHLEFHYSQKKEINEAIAAGEKVLEGLYYAIQYLRQAKNWGIYDMVGGGLLATAIKHSKIDEAKELIHGVQVWLRKFKRELSDVRISEYQDLNIRMDSFSTFADYFFDNLIFDWVVQSKINRSLDGCINMQSQVSKIVDQLKSTEKTATQKYNSTKSEFNNYIENSL